MTIRTLLDVATVIEDDASFTKGTGYEFDDLGQGREFGVADICSPPDLQPTDTPAGTGFKSVPFAQWATQEFGVRCAPEDADVALTLAMQNSAEHFLTHQLWYGDVEDWSGFDENVYLTSPEVVTIAAAANVPASIAAALSAAYAEHPDLRPVVHLGLAASFALPVGWADEHGLTVVQGSGYPPGGIAVTGSLIVHLGAVETLPAVNTSVNRKYVSSTRLMSIEFAPSSAVRVSA